MPLPAIIALASLGLDIGNQLISSRDQANKDKKLDRLLSDKQNELQSSRGDINTYFDELQKQSEQGFNLGTQTAFDEFRQRSLDIKSESEATKSKTNFSGSGIEDTVFSNKSDINSTGLERTLANLALKQDSAEFGIEKGRTDRFSQLESDIFNIKTTRNSLDTSSFLGNLFG